jgi:hypothetical protein
VDVFTQPGPIPDTDHIEPCFTSEDPPRLTQTDTLPQFWLLGEDVDQPRYTSFGSVQSIGWRNVRNARIVLYGRPLPAIFDVPPKFLEPVATIWSRKNIHASVVLGIFDADKNGP